MNELDVYLHDDQVGRLERLDNADLRFTYQADWVEDGGLPLSHSLPLRHEPFDDRDARPFFAGLLPEGDFRKAVARAFHASTANSFSLLAAIGGECAGAVSLLEQGESLPAQAPPRWLDAAELAVLIRKLPAHPLHLLLGDEDEGLRLSLAGAQNKLPVLFVGGRLGITHGSPPSTHIIKLPAVGFEWLAENEAFCLELGRAAGLDTVTAGVRYPDGVFADVLSDARYLLMERYDRISVGGERHRLHQEDVCQALGYLPEQKYESDGGPGLAACAHHIREVSTAPAVDVLAFADAVFFNFIIGNRDAHSKNFSLLLEGEYAPRLAPLYDLLSTTAYRELDRKLPMKLGGEKRADYLRPRHIERMAAELEVSGPGLRKRALDLCDRVEGVYPDLAQSGPGPNAFRASLVFERIEQQIRRGLSQVREACLRPG